MARIRSIKPSFFRSEDVSALPLRARLTWIGLWTHCDDAGRTKDNVRLIKGDVWPLDDVSLRDIEQDLETLAGHGRIVRYEVDGRRYLEIANWSAHQSIQKPTPSRIPGPDEGKPVDSGSPPVVVPEASANGTARKGREGNGREGTRAAARDGPLPAEPPSAEPPSKCPKHLDDPEPPPCGQCADARRANARWIADRPRRQAEAPRCPTHRGELAHNCRWCAADRKAAPDPESP